MTTVVFYQKPGCRTNVRQIEALRTAGHQVIVRSLFSEVWTEQRLRAFFGDTPVSAWFNPASPKIKSGLIDPDAVDATSALRVMLADPLLIRRPLIEAGDARCAGFDRDPVPSLLNGNPAGAALQDCSRPESARGCAARETGQS